MLHHEKPKLYSFESIFGFSSKILKATKKLAILNNISAISWRSVLLVDESGEPEKTTDKLDHIML